MRFHPFADWSVDVANSWFEKGNVGAVLPEGAIVNRD